MTTKTRTWILGIDLGSASIGWAAVGATERVLKDGTVKLTPKSIVDAGVRIFEAGVEGDIQAGKDASRAAVRREARQPRRQNWRTRFRKQKLFGQLQRFALLPESKANTSEKRKEVLEELDGLLAQRYLPDISVIDKPSEYHQLYQKLPYILRAKAAAEPVDTNTLGRAIYHLAQRRGFLSNRKSDVADDEEAGKVKTAINEFHKVMRERSFSQTIVDALQPADGPADEDAETKGKVRGRYLARKWMHDEFDAIRKMQQPHHDIDDAAWETLRKTIFFQRPLKSQRTRIGKCELETNRPRADIARPAYQEYRVLHQVNSLRYQVPDGPEMALSDEQRQAVLDQLMTAGDLSFSKVKKAAGLKKSIKFTIEEWGEKRVVGHRTNAKLAPIFGESWWQMSVDERDAITLEVLHYRKGDALQKRAINAWGVSKEAAADLAKVRLEEGTARHSRIALEKLNAVMRNGTAYSTARKKLYPEKHESGKPLGKLPPLSKVLPDLNNPAVIRALTELRKVVNELIARYGKPAAIRTETARELKQSRDRRMRSAQQMRQQEARREKAKAEMLKQIPGFSPSREDIQKWLLAEECNWQCPYTGNPISARKLIGDAPQFDVEHIYPRRYLDNSMRNKTLCDSDFNRNRKRDRIPRDCFPDGNPDFDAMLQRVRNFNSPDAREKLKRFEADEVDDDFTNRHLADTRFNAVVAAEYLGTLYGGRWDADGRQRVFTPAGGLTWMLRTGWELNGLLGGDGSKQRNDHRHHALDAFIVALSDQQRISAVAEAAQDAEKLSSRRFLKAVEAPWKGFDDDLRQVLDGIVVSHRPTRSVSGPMHAETMYSPERTTYEKASSGDRVEKVSHHVRKRVDTLSAAELKGDAIVDPVVRKAVLEKLAELGQTNASKAFADPANHPTMPSKAGAPGVPIHKVRVRASKSARPVGQGARQRLVASGKDSNFASMVYAVLDRDGNETKWEHEIIDRLTAYQRLSDNKKKPGEKILIPDEQNGRRRFKFALVKNDTIELDGTGDEEGQRVLYKVQKLSEDEITFSGLKEAKPPTNQTKEKRFRGTRGRAVDGLRKRDAILTEVSPSGILANRNPGYNKDVI